MEQIIYLLVINLDEWAKNIEFSRGVLQMFENSVDWSRNYTGKIIVQFGFIKIGDLLFRLVTFLNKVLPVASEHSKSFPRASLPICKDGEVKAFKYFFYERFENLEYLELGGLLRYNLIEFALNVVDLIVIDFQGFILPHLSKNDTSFSI